MYLRLDERASEGRLLNGHMKSLVLESKWSQKTFDCGRRKSSKSKLEPKNSKGVISLTKRVRFYFIKLKVS